MKPTAPCPAARPADPRAPQAAGAAPPADGHGPGAADHIVQGIVQALEPLRDAEAARAMRAYQRDQFPFLGIAAPRRRAAVAGLVPTGLDASGALDCAERLWSLAEREYRYSAVDLLARRQRALTLDHLGRLLALARRDPWWDTVDGLAGVIGDLLRRERCARADAQTGMDAALRDASLWVRRIAMIHQLGWRLDTDEARLYAYADALAPEQDFFIRKAIGWALRDYARWNAPSVAAYVASRDGRLSALTRREALKHLGGGRA